jgi:hypothetical protein
MDGGGLLDNFKDWKDHRQQVKDRRPVKIAAWQTYEANVPGDRKGFEAAWLRAKELAAAGESIEAAADTAIAEAIFAHDAYRGEAGVEAIEESWSESSGFAERRDPLGEVYERLNIFESAKDGVDPSAPSLVMEHPAWLFGDEENGDEFTRYPPASEGIEDDFDDDYLPMPPRGGAARNATTSFVLGGIVLLMSVLGSMAR